MPIARDCDVAQRWKNAEDAIDKALLVWRAQQTSPASLKQIGECENLFLESVVKGTTSRVELMPTDSSIGMARKERMYLQRPCCDCRQ